ncbi:MBL fold metallo-hydrolase [Sphingomonas sp.]|uniref:MBL fold metallo-hydrolase n=1 Tax=Sphingomonas sp. TaxID=28214 RepID=UPI00286E5362|nr:MBL fold metallo-hydrolase [Sphingomonas sp.]
MKLFAFAVVLAAASCATANPPAYHLIPGSIPPDKGPDGNTVVLDAPDGLIVIDTGRHPAHSAAILAYARERGRPIAAIVNTHWHLDHTTGNHDLRQLFPRAEVYATNAVDGALATFLRRSRAQSGEALDDPKTSPAAKAEMVRGHSVIDNPERIRPTRPVTQSGPLKIAGRQIDVRVAHLAATEDDLWLYDPKTKVAIVGDLVVGTVPFMDTACPDGWAKALDAIAATPFTTLIPGHGDPMTRTDFLQWRTAYTNLLACARSDADKTTCIAGWQRDAAKSIHDQAYAAAALDYYIDSRLRSSPEEQQRYCKPLK